MPLPPHSLGPGILEGGARYAGCAQAAGPLLQRYARVQNDAEKAATVEALNEVFQDIRFRHLAKDRLLVYYLEGRIIKIPASVRMHASLILKVQLDGRAVVEKDRGGRPGRLIPAMELLAELGGVIPRRSRWEMIGNDEDWI